MKTPYVQFVPHTAKARFSTFPLSGRPLQALYTALFQNIYTFKFVFLHYILCVILNNNKIKQTTDSILSTYSMFEFRLKIYIK
jgi:hypothetical protein